MFISTAGRFSTSAMASQSLSDQHDRPWPARATAQPRWVISATRWQHTHFTIIQRVYVYLYICVYVMLLRLDALHLGRQTFRGSSTTPQRSRQFYPAFTISRKPCSYYVQLSVTIVPSHVTQGQGVTRRYYNCQYYVTISRVGFQEANHIFTGSTKYQGIDEHFCDNIVYPEIF